MGMVKFLTEISKVLILIATIFDNIHIIFVCVVKTPCICKLWFNL